MKQERETTAKGRRIGAWCRRGSGGVLAAMTLGAMLTVGLNGIGGAKGAAADGGGQRDNGDRPTFEQTVQPFFEAYCLQCHGPDEQESDLRVDQLGAFFDAAEAAEQWLDISDVLFFEEMPPDDAERQPTEAEREAVIRWIDDAERNYERQEAEPRSRVRRLNRVEYENTMHDLLGIDRPLKDMLPEDGKAHGFDNAAEALNISSVLMERYLEAADAALDAAIDRYKPAELVDERFRLLEERIREKTQLEDDLPWLLALEEEDAVVKFRQDWPEITIHNFHAPQEGRYRFRIEFWPYQPQEEGRSMALSAFTGDFGRGGKSRMVGFFDVTGSAEEPRVVEFTERLEVGDHLRLDIYGIEETWHAFYKKPDKKDITVDEWEGEGVAIRAVEVKGPLEREWPSESHRRLFGDLPMEKQEATEHNRWRGRFETYAVQSPQPKEDAARLLRDFVPRAFRRPAPEAEIEPYIALVHERLDAGYPFEQAMRVGFKAVLCSPQFLLVNEGSGSVDDFALASRLSYFLWSTMPDEELMELARRGELADPAVLHEQVERMLNSEKAALSEHFLGQWLDLREIDATSPDQKLYPEFDEMLKVSMLEESRRFFRHLLERDGSVLNFVDSDFSMLNERLAEHYGIEGGRGYEDYPPVELPADSPRGGVLTQASVLKVTANGTNTSPVLRGVWVLENIIGRPTPPPPEGVPAVEPDIRGTTTVREQFAAHTEAASCARCHQRIDPPGFALESFDVIGGWRERYRSLGEGESVDKRIGGRRVAYKLGPEVSSGDTTPDGQTFENIEGFKALLLEDPERIARTVAKKLLVYATGRGIGPGDRRAVEAIVERAAEDDFGLRSMVHAVVESEAFRRR